MALRKESLAIITMLIICNYVLSSNFDSIPESIRVRKSVDNTTSRSSLKNLNETMKQSNNETEFGRLLDATEMTTEYDNFTEEPCVGDRAFCNLTREEYMEMLNDYVFPQPYEWVLIATHAIVFVIGLIGNALVCIAVYRNHSMRTVTNYFIVNLAVADFMVILICLPPTVLWDVTETWFFGTAMCRIVLYFQSVSVTVSVLTLTFISVDRWYAICFPLKFKSTTGRAKTAILIIWLLSLLFNIPEFVVLQVQTKMQLRFNVQYFMQCASTWSDESDLTWHIIKALFLYTFPLLLMTIAYCQIVRVLWRSDNIPGHTESHKLCSTQTGQSNWLAASRRTTPSIHTNASTEGQLRSRRKAAKMLVAVVAMFAVCYFPVHLLSVLRVAFDVQQTDVMTCIALISHVMCYANSAVNPLIYNFMSGKFRREFHRSYFKCFCCCHTTPAPEQNGASFEPIGSSRARTIRTTVRRHDSCVSYRLAHLSPSNHNIHRDYIQNTNTSFIEPMNGNRRSKIRDESISDTATRFTVTTDIPCKD
ncbi:neuropeptide receptor A5 isoform X1 [Bombyx mori]|uniref:Neuropeptide receptor A5 n=1 Tax=Bombyx mori TaxID=7091 RepID=B3XXL7_BOMMO|nr:neuropeptide receptor A5 precursor [Bombyx mori]XP_037873765.1 neuropeptide receptor A5 isoform X1 [Bombyx mori]BAG68403.1 neuropeptide receptor A5 [Bombyx mori]